MFFRDIRREMPDNEAIALADYLSRAVMSINSLFNIIISV